ncbi:hypothetical protein NL676_003888 [Syzygium grande]|nr:hypothetical protein NL676_003888 [Syzygium grande]
MKTFPPHHDSKTRRRRGRAPPPPTVALMKTERAKQGTGELEREETHQSASAGRWNGGNPAHGGTAQAEERPLEAAMTTSTSD